MNMVLAHEDGTCFKSLLSHVKIIYFTEMALSQSQAGGSQHEPIDNVL